MTKRQSTADKEGFVVLSDTELKQGVENRARQLESELAGHRVLLEEAKADPHDDTSEETHQKAIESTEARLKVVHQRLAHLRSTMPDEEAQQQD